MYGFGIVNIALMETKKIVKKFQKGVDIIKMRWYIVEAVADEYSEAQNLDN